MTIETDVRVIDALIARHDEIRAFLDEHDEVSLRDYTDGEFPQSTCVKCCQLL